VRPEPYPRTSGFLNWRTTIPRDKGEKKMPDKNNKGNNGSKGSSSQGQEGKKNAQGKHEVSTQSRRKMSEGGKKGGQK
jgi:hypothetical protein